MSEPFRATSASPIGAMHKRGHPPQGRRPRRRIHAKKEVNLPSRGERKQSIWASAGAAGARLIGCR